MVPVEKQAFNKHLLSWIGNVEQAEGTATHHFKISTLILILLE